MLKITFLKNYMVQFLAQGLSWQQFTRARFFGEKIIKVLLRVGVLASKNANKK